MDLSKMTPEEARAIVMQAQNVFDASIADQQRTSPKEIQSLPLDLSVARTREQALRLSFPFKSVLVEQATDINTYVYLVPISNDSGNDPIRLGLKDIYKNEFGFRECYIYWDAQGSKSILLKFFIRSFLENGRLVLDQNSNFVTKSIGYGTSQDDGFTIITSSVMELPVATVGTSVVKGASCLNDITFSNGTLNLPALTTVNFKVPSGYIGEVVGTSIVTQFAALPTTSWRMYLCAVPEGSSIANFAALSGYSIGSIVNLSDIPKSLTPMPVEVSALSSPDLTKLPRNRKILLEGECLVLGLYQDSTVATTLPANVRIYNMIRLTKKVG